MRIILICFVAYISLGACGISLADTPQSSTIYSALPFDTSVQQLPPGFMGYDPKKLLLGVSPLVPIKGEFETTADFNQRVAGFAHAKIDDNLSVSDCLSFRVQAEKVSSKYNADAQMLTVSLEPFSYDILKQPMGKDADTQDYGRALALHSGGTDLNPPKDGYSICCGRITIDGGTYSAENGFGATFAVHKQTLVSFELYVQNAPDFQFIRNYDKNSRIGFLDVAKLPLSVDAAIAAKPNVAVLAICHLRPYKSLYVNMNQFATSATAQDPTEDTFSVVIFNMTIDSFWVYDTVTGKIYSKIVPLAPAK